MTLSHGHCLSHKQWKEGKLYFRTLADKSYYSNKYVSAYLDCSLDERGQQRIRSYQNQMDKILASSNSSSTTKEKEERDKVIQKLQDKISNVYDKREYQVFSMNIRGLLSYALDESDYNEFNKSIENLAECDEYQEVREPIDTYNELGQRSDFTIYFNYMIKRNFPFLSYYNDFKHILPGNFAAKLIKKIAKRLKYILDKASPDHLKYVVTEQFFDEIKPSLLIQDNENNNNRIDNNDDVSKAVEHYYISEISTYLNNIKKRDLIQQQNSKIFQNIKNRRNSLMEKLHRIIKNNNENNNNEVIPIYDSIIESRLSWFDFSDILKSIEKIHGNRFIITDKCIIPKQKAKKLKSLLKGRPTYNDACLSLIENGVSQMCFGVQDAYIGFFHKLGFTTAYEDENDWNSNLIVVKKKRNN